MVMWNVPRMMEMHRGVAKVQNLKQGHVIAASNRLTVSLTMTGSPPPERQSETATTVILLLSGQNYSGMRSQRRFNQG
jgi:hypothetical protein